MAEPENAALILLSEMRATLNRLEQLDKKIDENHVDLRLRLNDMHEALIGESVLGRYAAAEVEERLEAIEKRLLTLESTR